MCHFASSKDIEIEIQSARWSYRSSYKITEAEVLQGAVIPFQLPEDIPGDLSKTGMGAGAGAAVGFAIGYVIGSVMDIIKSGATEIRVLINTPLGDGVLAIVIKQVAEQICKVLWEKYKNKGRGSVAVKLFGPDGKEIDWKKYTK